MKHILHINSNYLTSKLHENLADQIKSLGYSQTIYMPMKKETLKEVRFKSKHDIYPPIAFRDWHKWFYSYKQNIMDRTLNERIDMNRFDVIHAHTLFTDGNLAYTNAKRYNIPFVVTVRESTDKDFYKRRPHLRTRGKNILMNASVIIFLTEKSRTIFLDHLYKDVKKQLAVKSKVIPNGIDAFWFKNKSESKILYKADTVKLLYVGRILRRKNVALIIKALDYLNTRRPGQFSLTVVGDCHDLRLMRDLKALSSGKKVIFKDRADQQELLKIYREHDIFVMPSFRETFGLVYIEAMSQGLPVIYSTEGGINGTFKEGEVGFAADPYSAEDLANKLNQIVSQYSELSSNAVSNFLKFDWDAIGREYAGLYSGIFNQSEIEEIINE